MNENVRKIIDRLKKNSAANDVTNTKSEKSSEEEIVPKGISALTSQDLKVAVQNFLIVISIDISNNSFGGQKHMKSKAQLNNFV